MSLHGGVIPLRHKDARRLAVVTDAFVSIGVPLHRDQLFEVLGKDNGTLFTTPAQLTAFLNRHAGAFPCVGEGVYWSEVADLHAKARDSSDHRRYVALGRAAWMLLRDPARAEVAFSRALELSIEDADAHRGLADVYLAQARWKDAAGVLRWLNWKHPNQRKTLGQLATCFEREADWNSAVDCWALLSEKYPNDPGVLVRLGVAAFEDDDEEVCVEALQAALAVDDELALAHVILARLAFEGDAPVEAFNHLERALELDPSSVAERCPGPLLDAFLDWSSERETWIAELERHMRFR